MSRSIQFTLPVVELSSLSGQRVTMPLGFTDTFQVGISNEGGLTRNLRQVNKIWFFQGHELMR
jgi:hypothetical protein